VKGAPSPERKLVAALAFVQFAHIVDFLLLMPLGPQLMRDFDIRADRFSWVVSSYSIAGGLVGLLAAGFVDRFDRRNALRIAYVALVLATASCSLAPSFVALMLARAATGVCAGVLGALVFTIVADVVPIERRGAAVGMVMTAFSLASIAGVPCGLALANLFGSRAAFLALALFCVPGGIFAWSVVPSVRGHLRAAHAEGPRPPAPGLRVLREEPGAKYALLLIVTLVLGQFTVIPFLSPAMVSNGLLTQAQLPWVYLLGGAFTTVSNPLIGRAVDRLGAPRIFTAVVLSSMVFLMIVSFTPPGPLPAVLVLTTLFFITVSGRMNPAMVLITGSVMPKNRGALMTLNISAQQLTAGLSATLAGQILTQGPTGRLENYPYVGALAVAFSSLSIVVATRVKPRS
jgi:MFS transporter, DHA1 family, inner membrane transport protein